jgi:hypothetical protein
MISWRNLPGVVVGCLAAGGLALTSGVPWFDAASDTAALRLSLRLRPERIESCRIPTAEEVDATPDHMRQRTICEGISASYQLRLAVGTTVLTDVVVRGGGLRHDRPIHVLRDHEVQPGTHRVMVTIMRRETAAAPDTTASPTPGMIPLAPDTGVYAGRAGREVIERDRRRLAVVPATLTFDTVITFPRGHVMLVTFDPEQRRLRLLTPPRR